MPGIFDVSADDVASLNPYSLVALMSALIENELQAHGIPLSASYVSMDITTPDAGEDGIVEWTGGPNVTDFFPGRRCLFQAKAGKLTPKKFTDELFVGGKRKSIKPRVKLNFDNDGAYILLYAGTCVGKDAEQRIKEMKAALASFYPRRQLHIYIYDQSKIAAWAMRHLATTITALRLARKSGLESFRSVRDWSGFKDNQTKFIENEQTRRIISQIRSAVAAPKSFMRLVGRSGLGKTRTAYEAFKEPIPLSSDTKLAALSGAVAYVDYLDESAVVNLVSQIRSRGVNGVVVVDNCPEDVHDRLVEQVTHENSKLSLLTIDYHVDTLPEKLGVFRLEASPVETIRDIVREAHPTLDERSIDFIAHYADGFPKIAALLRDVPLEEDLRVGPLSDRTLTERLLRGRGSMSEPAERVIEACALFVHLGFYGNVKGQREYVAEKVCGITGNEFADRASFFFERVLDRIGDFVRVSPVPLALRLAEAYYDRRGPETYEQLFADNDMPAPLKEALGKRFKDLSITERAEEVARRLMGPNDPFGNAEVLNTEQGSSIFRSLAEASPAIAIQTLEREFGGWSTEQLLSVGPGRRNLIWTLEVLAFNADVFIRSARMLAKFAAAENETWGNNATAQFLHLFQPLLSGTEAAPPARLHVIDELLASNDVRLLELAIDALGRAIGHDSGGRMMGAEQQRGRVLKDWYPSTWGELFQYLDGAVERLNLYARRDNALGERARKRFADGIRNLVRYQRFESTEQTIRDVVELYPHAWPDAVEAVHSALRYELRKGDDENINRVASWLSLLQPQSEVERIRLVVSIPPFGNFVESENGQLVDLSAEAAKQLAATYANSLTRWQAILPIISKGEQRQGLVFGQTIGYSVADETQRDYVDSTFAALRDAGREANPTVLCGILLGLKNRSPRIVSEALSRVFEDSQVSRFAAYVASSVGMDEHYLQKVMSLLENGMLAPDELRRFGYGRALAHIKPKVVCQFLSRLAAFNLDGAYAALFVGFMYSKDEDESKWTACKPLFRRIATTKGVFQARRETFDKYALEESIKRLLEDSNERKFAVNIANRILAVAKKRDFDFGAYDVMRPVMFKLLERHRDDTWPLVEKALASSNALTQWHIKELLKRDMLMHEAPDTALLYLSDEQIEEWCREQPQIAPRLIAQSIALFNVDGDDVHVNPLVEHVIDRYGQDEAVLSALTSNLGSFGFQGSLVPAFQQRLSFAKHFTNHRLATVRKWAACLVSSFEADVRSEKKRDEEREHGIWQQGFGADDE